MNETDLNIDT